MPSYGRSNLRRPTATAPQALAGHSGSQDQGWLIQINAIAARTGRAHTKTRVSTAKHGRLNQARSALGSTSLLVCQDLLAAAWAACSGATAAWTSLPVVGTACRDGAGIPTTPLQPPLTIKHPPPSTCFRCFERLSLAAHLSVRFYLSVGFLITTFHTLVTQAPRLLQSVNHATAACHVFYLFTQVVLPHSTLTTVILANRA